MLGIYCRTSTDTQETGLEQQREAGKKWAKENGRAEEIFYQIGDGIPPSQGSWVRQFVPDEFEKHCREAELIVSHAGTGILMVAAELKQKLLIFPRRFSEPGEIRNDHQMDSGRRWAENHAATVAFTVEELYVYLNDPKQILIPKTDSPGTGELIDAVRLFVHTGTLPSSKK